MDIAPERSHSCLIIPMRLTMKCYCLSSNLTPIQLRCFISLILIQTVCSRSILGLLLLDIMIYNCNLKDHGIIEYRFSKSDCANKSSLNVFFVNLKSMLKKTCWQFKNHYFTCRTVWIKVCTNHRYLI